MMKFKSMGLLLALAMVLGVMALPAAANVPVGSSIGVFQGQADVGKHGACEQDGSGNVDGGGLGLVPNVNTDDPLDPQIEQKRAWYTIDAENSVVDAVRGIGSLKLCGKLGPNLTGLGASCATTKGWDGKGKADFDHPVFGTSSVHITNLGWIATLGGTFIVTGDVGGEPKKKEELLLAQVQALDEAVLVNCLTKEGKGKEKTGGATTFEVVASYEIVPNPGVDNKKDDNEDPKPKG